MDWMKRNSKIMFFITAPFSIISGIILFLYLNTALFKLTWLEYHSLHVILNFGFLAAVFALSNNPPDFLKTNHV